MSFVSLIVSLVIAAGGGGVTPGPPISAVTTQPLVLYVATTGNDGGPCSVSSPCLTIQAAVNRIPKIVSHAVTIRVAAGTYEKGAYIKDFNFWSKSPYTDIPAITVLGELSLVTPTTGPASGTATSATVGSSSTTTWGTLTLTGAGWTVDDFKGKLLEITGGGGYSTTTLLNTRVITASTSDTITVAGAMPAGVGATTQFRIATWATIIGRHVAWPPYPQASGFANAAAFWIGNSTSTAILNPIVLDRLHMKDLDTTGSNASAVYLDGAVRLLMYGAKSEGFGFPVNGTSGWSGNILVYRSVVDPGTFTTATTLPAFGQGFAALRDSYVYKAGATFVAPTSAGYVRSFTGNLLVPASGAYAAEASIGGLAVSGTKVDCSLGGYGVISESGTTSAPRNSTADVVVWSSSFTSCVIGVYIGAGASARLTGVTGTGNTTAISVRGAQVSIASDVTITGTTELSIDGAAYTLSQMRAAVPKSIFSLQSGAHVFE